MRPSHRAHSWPDFARRQRGRVAGSSSRRGAALLPAGSDAWGTVGPSLRLMAGLKERFDPRHTLNPGRFVGGI